MGEVPGKSSTAMQGRRYRFWGIALTEERDEVQTFGNRPRTGTNGNRRTELTGPRRTFVVAPNFGFTHTFLSWRRERHRGGLDEDLSRVVGRGRGRAGTGGCAPGAGRVPDTCR